MKKQQQQQQQQKILSSLFLLLSMLLFHLYRQTISKGVDFKIPPLHFLH